MTKKEYIKNNRDLINQIAKKYKAISISLFGSVVRNQDDEHSDIDFLVTFEPTASLFEWIELKQALSELLSCPVDIATINSLKPRIRDRVLQEAELL